MDFKLFKQAVANLNWKLNYFEFCQQILKINEQQEFLEKDQYCLKKWEQWQLLNKTLDSFNEDTLERIISVYESRVNH